MNTNSLGTMMTFCERKWWISRYVSQQEIRHRCSHELMSSDSFPDARLYKLAGRQRIDVYSAVDVRYLAAKIVQDIVFESIVLKRKNAK